MAFASVIGQDRIKNFLGNALKNKRLSHAYLLSGPEGAGCEALAIAFANYLLNHENPDASEDHRIRNLSHPDVHLIFPSPAKTKEEEYQEILHSLVVNPYLRLQPWANPSISIEKIREIKRKSAYKSFEGRGKVFIILDCERMTTEASNSLLKVLEEPSDKTYLLMTSSKPNLLLSTITSRCQMIKLDPLSAEEIESALKKQTDNADSKIKLAARLAGGSFRQALELLNEDLDNWQQQALDLFLK